MVINSGKQGCHFNQRIERRNNYIIRKTGNYNFDTEWEWGKIEQKHGVIGMDFQEQVWYSNRGQAQS